METTATETLKQWVFLLEPLYRKLSGMEFPDAAFVASAMYKKARSKGFTDQDILNNSRRAAMMLVYEFARALNFSDASSLDIKIMQDYYGSCVCSDCGGCRGK